MSNPYHDERLGGDMAETLPEPPIQIIPDIVHVLVYLYEECGNRQEPAACQLQALAEFRLGGSGQLLEEEEKFHAVRYIMVRKTGQLGRKRDEKVRLHKLVDFP